MAADTLDILAIAEAEKDINVPSGSHTAELEQAITAVSRRIDEICGPVVQRTITGERHDGGTRLVFLRETPITSITTVTEYSSGVATVLTAETETTAGTYRYEDSIGALYRRSSWTHATFASQSVVVTYEAGRYADTASVDRRFKQAAGSILRRLWDREAGAWARPDDPFDQQTAGGSSRFFNAVDHVVKEMLADEMRAPAVA